MVLVVDDSLTVRKITTRLLTREGFRVDSAKDGVDALEKMRDLLPDIVLLDVEMPRMNGLEVTRNLRNHVETRDLPVVMITSRATEKHQAMAEQAGVTRMLGKPFSEDTLVALVRGLIADRSTAETSAT